MEPALEDPFARNHLGPREAIVETVARSRNARSRHGKGRQPKLRNRETVSRLESQTTLTIGAERGRARAFERSFKINWL